MSELQAPDTEVDFGMSNFDHQIDEGLEAALRERPGEVYGRHAGWEFNGLVWFQDGKFHEQVWRYGSPREVISAGTLQELMEAVNNEWGWS